MTKNHASLPNLRADLLLLHAPAFFDFRQRSDIYFPFLATSGDVPITPLYEYFPLGFKTLQRYLSDRGFVVKLMNLSTLLLRYPDLDINSILSALDVKLVGIDLHWMVHVQGALATADAIKAARPDLPIVFGGISSTYYANELIMNPSIDFVMRGYDTHHPMALLMDAVGSGGDFAKVPNLMWKSAEGSVKDNGLSYLPDDFGCGIDWTKHPGEAVPDTFPILEVVATQSAGCVYDCQWCGGSRSSFRRIYGRRRAMVSRPVAETDYEFEQLKRLQGSDRFHYYSISSYNKTKAEMEAFLGRVSEADLRSISYEQFYLTPDDVLEKMARSNPRTTITLSPESHDIRVAKLAGRGVFTNEELERWLDKALDMGISGIDVWYFIGMPEQDEKSVMGTVDYCVHLLEKFKGSRVNPMICPMVPFLDPASTFFENPSDNGYRLFSRTVEEHRRAMTRASIINRMNYETRWLTRSEIVHLGYRAIRQLMEAKAANSFLPRSLVSHYISRIDDAVGMIDAVHEVDSLTDETARRRGLEALGGEILQRNNMVFSGAVSNQALPINRQIGGRWFDELGWDAQILDDALTSRDDSTMPNERGANNADR